MQNMTEIKGQIMLSEVKELHVCTNLTIHIYNKNLTFVIMM